MSERFEIPLSEQLGANWGIPGAWIEPHLAAAEERGRRRGIELLRECDEALKIAMGTVECMSVFPPGHELAGRELYWHKLAVAVRAKIAALAPRDPGPAPGCLCQGGKTQPYCAYCLGMSSPCSSAPVSDCPLVGCQIIGKHEHRIEGPAEARK